MQTDFLYIGRKCLLQIEHVIYAFRTQNISDGFCRVSALSRIMMEWYQTYIKCMGNQATTDAAQKLEWVLTSVLNAMESRDGILIADLLELQLRPQIYEIQALLLEQGVPCISYETFHHNLESLWLYEPELASRLGLNQEKVKNDAYSIWEEFCRTYVGEGYLEPSSSGYATYSVPSGDGVVYVHSNVNPQWEGYQQARRYYSMDQEDYFLFGIGLGYLPFALTDMDCSINLTICETSKINIYMAMLANPLDWLFGNKNVTFVYDPECKDLFSFMRDEATPIFTIGAIADVQDAKLREQLELLDWRMTNIYNLQPTFRQNFRINTRNCLHSVDELKHDFAGKRAVIVAAGPSLDKNISLLRKRPANTLIVAVGTVFKLLMREGIVPDYICFSESGKDVFEQLADMLDNQLPIFLCSTAYYRLSEEYKGSKYLVCQKGYAPAEDYAKRQGLHTYETGGSVATLALSVCMQLGCSEIAFVGLDLSYSEGNTHAEGTRTDARMDLQKYKPMQGIEGNTVYVSKEFQMYREWIERFVSDRSSYPCKRVIDATEGGVLKKNMEILTLEEVFIEWEAEGNV